MVFEERMDQLRRKEKENRMLNDQIAVLKLAIGKLELEGGGGIDDVEGMGLGVEAEMMEGDMYTSAFHGNQSSFVQEEENLTTQLERLQAARSDLKELHALVARGDESFGTVDGVSGLMTLAKHEKDGRNNDVHAEGGILVMEKSIIVTDDDGEVVNDI